ncbi:MAG: insulinase family protein [Alistipes sp.]|nr:insulinase family protein [Alistipes sp.]
MAVAAAIIAATASAQMQPIPADPQLRTGKLENGMTYYIRHNEKPKGQADFYILHNVGAIQEDDNQQGLAHFLEHMAFNGTKNLPGKTLIEYLEKVGVKFGANLNAATSWDYTIYLMKDVPVHRESIIDTALLVLHDWSQFIALEPEEMDAERGVIMNELRQRDGASWRSTINMLKTVAKGTKYEERNLIGYLDGLKSFNHDDLSSFYHKWYRPDYQAVMIAGDVDVDLVENKLKALMADIPAPAADAARKDVIVIPDNEEPVISIFTDKEMPYSQILIFDKRSPMLPQQFNNTVQKEMLEVITEYIDRMGDLRFQEMAMKPDAPFTRASIGNGSFGICPTLEVTSFSAMAQEGRLEEAAEALFTEAERIRRHGFTAGEFERAQNELLRSAERKYTNRNDRNNGEFISVYQNNFQHNTAMPDAETEWQIDSMLITQVNLDIINQFCSQLISADGKNRVIVVNAPEKEGLENPSESQILNIMNEVAASEIAAFEDNSVKEPLIDGKVKLKGSKVKKTENSQVPGTVEWTLKNGVKVVVKPTQFKADEVLFSAVAEGGTSIIADDDFYTASFLPVIASMSGVSKFPMVDLRKQLSGKTANIGLSVEEYEHGMGGSCSPKDVETLLQLLYLRFTDPRFDEGDLNTVIKQYTTAIENMLTNPDYISEEAVSKTLYNDNMRKRIISLEAINGIRFDRLPAVYRTLYNNAADFRFTFVGNVDTETLKPLVEKYIGSLPVSKQHSAAKDDGVRAAEGTVINDFKAPMLQPKVSVNRIFTGKIPYTLKNRLVMSFLSQALSSRYLISVREEKGGSYGVHVSGSLEDKPFEQYAMRIQFDTDDTMADELNEIIMDEIRKIADEGPLPEDIEKHREYLVKSWGNTLEQNGGWRMIINNWYDYNEDYIENYLDTVKGISYDDVRELAKKILADGNMTLVMMRPQTAE